MFLAKFPLDCSFSIGKCALLFRLGPSPVPTHSYLHLLDEIIVWNILLICHICLLDVGKGSCQGIAHCNLSWICCWAKFWILQDIDHMEASRIINVKIGTFDQLKQNKICILTVTTLGIAMSTSVSNSSRPLLRIRLRVGSELAPY